MCGRTGRQGDETEMARGGAELERASPLYSQLTSKEAPTGSGYLSDSSVSAEDVLQTPSPGAPQAHRNVQTPPSADVPPASAARRLTEANGCLLHSQEIACLLLQNHFLQGMLKLF